MDKQQDRGKDPTVSTVRQLVDMPSDSAFSQQPEVRAFIFALKHISAIESTDYRICTDPSTGQKALRIDIGVPEAVFSQTKTRILALVAEMLTRSPEAALGVSPRVFAI